MGTALKRIDGLQTDKDCGTNQMWILWLDLVSAVEY